MSKLSRLKPDPIPTIYPVPEYAADAELSAVYERTKSGLGVPWMGVVAMAFAHYNFMSLARLSQIDDASFCRCLQKLRKPKSPFQKAVLMIERLKRLKTATRSFRLATFLTFLWRLWPVYCWMDRVPHQNDAPSINLRGRMIELVTRIPLAATICRYTEDP